MAPKKKAKTAAPPLACFAGAKITVIGANPFQRKLWEAKIGNGTAFLKPSHAASLKEGNDFVVIVVDNVDPATVRAKAGAAQLVGDRWLTDSIARNERQNAAAHAWGAVEERPEEAAPARRSDVLPKFGCQRKITKADDQNKQLTGWLKQQLEWWQNGCVEGDASQHTAVGLTYKVIALIRSWPTKITPENWEDQRMLLAKQHFMSGRSSSANGGWLAYLEQLVMGGLPALQRVDAFTFWEKDPVRVAVKEITEMCKAASSRLRSDGVTDCSPQAHGHHQKTDGGTRAQERRPLRARFSRSAPRAAHLRCVAPQVGIGSMRLRRISELAHPHGRAGDEADSWNSRIRRALHRASYDGGGVLEKRQGGRS